MGAPRRLVPIETEATGAERYLAGRLDDPEYAEAYRKEREAIDVPDGYEVVVLPCEVVDHAAAFWPSESKGHTGPVGDACREAVARRQPATERVPWGEALIGRSVPGCPEPVDYVRRTPDGIHRFGSLLGGGKWERTASADGTVDVLVEVKS